MNQRPVAHIPAYVMVLLAFGLAMQLVWHYQAGTREAIGRDLDAPMSASYYRLLSLNDPIMAARVTDLWLQSYDTQAGISLPFKRLNYDYVVQWLERILSLDEADTYPLLVAANIYARVNDPQRVRKMLDFIEVQFDKNPSERWRWLADAAIIAKHKLHDLPLALKYANRLAALAGTDIPYWAKDMRLIILEDMGELETLKTLIGGLLAHGDITDPYEIRFLEQRLKELPGK